MIPPRGSRRWLGAAALVGAGIAVAVMVWLGSRRQPSALRQQVDSLQAANTALTQETERLHLQVATLTDRQARERARRDSAVRVSQATTTRLVQARATLPDTNAALPDTVWHAAYVRAVVQLDTALRALAHKDLLLARDAAMFALNDSLQTALRAELAATKRQVEVQAAFAQYWQDEYLKADKAAHPLCGRKCGIGIGVLATVLAAFTISQVSHAIHP